MSLFLLQFKFFLLFITFLHFFHFFLSSLDSLFGFYSFLSFFLSFSVFHCLPFLLLLHLFSTLMPFLSFPPKLRHLPFNQGKIWVPRGGFVRNGYRFLAWFMNEKDLKLKRVELGIISLVGHEKFSNFAFWIKESLYSRLKSSSTYDFASTNIQGKF